LADLITRATSDHPHVGSPHSCCS